MVIEKAGSEYASYRIPVLVMTQSGALVACYECRKTSSDWAEIDLKIIKSTDGGESWRTLRVVKGNGHTLNNPVFIVKGGVLHFLYCEEYKRVFYCKSEDDGESFSSPREISDIFHGKEFAHTVVAVGPSHGVVHNGNLLVPVWFAYNEKDPLAHRPSWVATIVSFDDGESWRCGERFGEGVFVNPSECSLVVDAQNKVLVSVRNENGSYRGFAESRTGYSAWQNIELRENMRDCICQGSTYSANGKIYHLNCMGDGRTQLTLKISDDGFLSYESIVIDEIGGYSDFVVKDETAFVLYERDGLRFEKRTLS